MPPATPTAAPMTICWSELERHRRPTAPQPRAGARPAARPSARCRPGRSRRTRPPAACRCARRSPAGRARRTPRPGRWAPARCRAAAPCASRGRTRSAPAAPATAAVTSVPATPSQTVAPAAERNRRRPMCMPPSKRITASATVTICSTVGIADRAQPRPQVGGDRGADQEDRRRRDAQPLAEPVGQHRERADAARSARIASPNGSTSVTTPPLPVRRVTRASADQTSRHTESFYRIYTRRSTWPRAAMSARLPRPSSRSAIRRAARPPCCRRT